MCLIFHSSPVKGWATPHPLTPLPLFLSLALLPITIYGDPYVGTNPHICHCDSASSSVCEIIMVWKSIGNMNFWKPCGFVCVWKSRNVHVDKSDMRTYEWICMVSSSHMINIYVCHTLVWWLTSETVAGREGQWLTCVPTFHSHHDYLYDHHSNYIYRRTHTCLRSLSWTSGHDLEGHIFFLLCQKVPKKLIWPTVSLTLYWYFTNMNYIYSINQDMNEDILN